MGKYYFEIARGQDHREVVAERETKSVSVENTFITDLELVSEIYGQLYKLTDSLLVRTQRHNLVGKTLTIKIKYADFESITRSRTIENGYFHKEEINKTIDYLVENLQPFPKGIRLLGLGVSNFLEEESGTGKQLKLEL